MAEYATLCAEELHKLWEVVPEGRRIAFLSSLEERSADRLLAFQRGEHARQPLVAGDHIRNRNREAVARYRARQRAAGSTD